MMFTRAEERPEDGTYWFRYDYDILSSGYFDESGDWHRLSAPREARLFCVAYRVLKTTPKGVWIERWSGDRKFILRSAGKRYAAPTRAEAMTSFIARRKRQIAILKAQLQNAQLGLAAARGEKPPLFGAAA